MKLQPKVKNVTEIPICMSTCVTLHKWLHLLLPPQRGRRQFPSIMKTQEENSLPNVFVVLCCLLGSRDKKKVYTTIFLFFFPSLGNMALAFQGSVCV